MPKPLPPSPIKPLAVSIAVDRLRVVLPVAAVALLVIAVTPGALLLLTQRTETAASARPDAAPNWSINSTLPAFTALAQEALGALPPPIDGQRLPPACDPDLEREVKGACWVPVDVKPCPPGKAYVNDDGPRPDGKCYARAMRAERTPTSGEVRHAGVAGP
jgi:hypothetical protein